MSASSPRAGRRVEPDEAVHVAGCAFQQASSLLALRLATGAIRVVRSTDSSLVTSRVWSPKPVSVCATSTGFGVVLPDSVRLLDANLCERLVVPVSGAVALLEFAREQHLVVCASGEIWFCTKADASCVRPALSGGSTIAAACRVGEHALCLRSDGVELVGISACAAMAETEGSEESVTARFTSIPGLDGPSCAASCDDEHAVIGAGSQLHLVSAAAGGICRVLHTVDAPFDVTSIATSADSPLDPFVVAAVMEGGSVFMLRFTGGGEVADEAVVPPSAIFGGATAIATDAQDFVHGSARDFCVTTSSGAVVVSPKALMQVARDCIDDDNVAVEDDDAADAAAIAKDVASSVLATSDAVQWQDLVRDDPEAAKHQREGCAITIAIDTADLGDLRGSMSVYVPARLVGDLKPVTRLIPIPASCRISKIREVAESIFDRRLGVAFETASGKVLELRPSTLRVFEATPDEEKSLVCRPMYPGVALSDRPATPVSTNRSAHGTSTVLGQSSIQQQPDEADRSRPASRLGSAHNTTANSRPATPALDRQAQSAMVSRLFDQSVAQRETKLKRLERQHYPTAATPPVGKQALNATIDRLAGKNAIGRRKEAQARARSNCMRDGTIIEGAPKRKLDHEEQDQLTRHFYEAGLKREKEKEKRLEEKLFKAPEARVKLRSKADLAAWHASMARDTRQKIRLPPDQLYYGKPSPRDRGRML